MTEQMAPTTRGDPRRILDVVAELLEERGYDGWALSDVAERARASMTTIYKHYPSRDDLIVAALERWMSEHTYRAFPEVDTRQPIFVTLRTVLRTVFEPWQEHPAMLQVFIRAATNPSGRDRLAEQGYAAIRPTLKAYQTRVDPAFSDGLRLILTNFLEGMLFKCLRGEVSVAEILPSIEECLFWLEKASPDDDAGGVP